MADEDQQACAHRNEAARARAHVRPQRVGPADPFSRVAVMCGRYSNTCSQLDEIQNRLSDSLGVAQPEDDRGNARFNVAPTQEVLAVVEDGAGRDMRLLRWG